MSAYICVRMRRYMYVRMDICAGLRRYRYIVRYTCISALCYKTINRTPGIVCMHRIPSCSVVALKRADYFTVLKIHA